MRDGGAAEYCVVPERMVLEVPDAINDELATLTEPLACVLNGTAPRGPSRGTPCSCWEPGRSACSTCCC